MKKRFNSYIDDNSLEHLHEDLVWNPKQKAKHKQRLLETINQLDSSQPAKSSENIFSMKQNRLLRNVVYCGVAIFILIGAFISSAFISPAMAQVVAEIPYLGQIFKKQPVSDEILNTLRRKGYKIDSLGQTYYGGRKQIEISIEGSDKYFKSVKGDITKTAKDILATRQYDTYTVKVKRHDPSADVYKPDPRKEKYDKINQQFTMELKKHNYDVLSVTIGGFQQRVELEVPDTEKRIEEIKQVINDVLARNNEENTPIKVYKINLKKQEQEGRWSDIILDVEEDLLGKDKYHVKLVGYSVHPEPQVVIYTSLSNSHDNKEFANELEQIVHEFLETKEMKDKIKGDSYKIIIYDKDKKKLNT
ncbi:DUF4030 domain-containing protein [Priestia megaterium]|uniref:DUF4030 domain-containing protein n=1 Tax=Priestia megaterium TaxID=1404 RepID=UPI00244CBD29|nr:DUF4030 domain-containing protein [Priestia megaterium]MDH2363432.1 DUF4030 domain-containing protein [Priestia megaterium]